MMNFYFGALAIFSKDIPSKVKSANFTFNGTSLWGFVFETSLVFGADYQFNINLTFIFEQQPN